MSIVVSLFPKANAGACASIANKPAVPSCTRARTGRSRSVEMTAEAAKFANAIKALSTIQGSKSELYQHLTYRSEMELTKNFKRAVELLLRFEKELNSNVGEEDHRTSELA
jgi:hypothetical protein